MCRNSRIVCSYRVVATFQKGTQVKIGSIPLRLSAFARCEFPCSDHFLIHAQTSPELDKIALFSAVMLDEHVTPRKWLAILVGFAGVLVTLAPSQADFNLWTLLPVLAAIFYALAAVVTKGKCANEVPMHLALALNIALLLMGVIGSVVVLQTGPHLPDNEGLRFLLGGWSPMRIGDWGVTVVLAILMVLVSTGIARAYQIGETSIIGAFDYTYLIFAIVWGALLFNEVQSSRTAAGLVLILVSGFILLKKATVTR